MAGVNISGTNAVNMASAGALTAAAASTISGQAVTASGTSVALGIVTATTGAVDIDATSTTVQLDGTVTAGTTIDINAPGNITVPNSSLIDAVGALTIASTGGTVSTAAIEGASVNVAGTGVTTGNVNATGTTVGIVSTTGGITVGGTLGAGSAAALTSTTGAVQVTGQVTAGSFAVNTAGGTISLDQSVVTNGLNGSSGTILLLTGAATPANVTTAALTSGTDAGSVAVAPDAIGDIRIQGATISTGTINSAGALTIAGTTGVTTGQITTATTGAISSTGGAITSSGQTIQTGAGFTVNSSGAGSAVTLGTLNIGGALDINSEGNVLLSSVTTTGGDVAVDVTSGTITVTDTLTSAGGVQLLSSGALTTQAISVGNSLPSALTFLGSTTGNVSLGNISTGAGATSGETAIAASAGSITLGSIDTLGNLTITAGVASTAATGAADGSTVEFTQNVTVTGGNIFLTADGLSSGGVANRLLPGLTFSAIPVGASGGNITFNLDNAFTITGTQATTTGVDPTTGLVTNRPLLTAVLRSDTATNPEPLTGPAAVANYGEFRLVIREGDVAIGSSTFVTAVQADPVNFDAETFQTTEATPNEDIFVIEGNFGLISPDTTITFRVENTGTTDVDGTLIAGEGRLGGSITPLSVFGEVNALTGEQVAIGGFNTTNPGGIPGSPVNEGVPVFLPVPGSASSSPVVAGSTVFVDIPAFIPDNAAQANGCPIGLSSACQTIGRLVPFLEFDDGDLLSIRFIDDDEEEDDPFTNRGDEEEWEGDDG